MTLSDIPTRRLQEVATRITPKGTRIRIGLYTSDGIDEIEVLKEHIDTELQLRAWRNRADSNNGK